MDQGPGSNSQKKTNHQIRHYCTIVSAALAMLADGAAWRLATLHNWHMPRDIPQRHVAESCDETAACSPSRREGADPLMVGQVSTNNTQLFREALYEAEEEEWAHLVI